MTIGDYIARYKEGIVEVSPGVLYSLRHIVDESYRLYHARFDDDGDESGFKKIFYRIAFIVHNSIVRGSDIDLKDLGMKAMNIMSVPIVGIMKMAVRSHLLRTYFGTFVDKVLNEMSWFGTIISKRVNGSVYTVDLRNIVRPPHISDIQESGIAEYVHYTFDQVYAKKDSWNNWDEVEKTIELASKEGLSGINVIEFWTFDTEINGNEIDGKVHKVCKKYLDRERLQPQIAEEPNSPDLWAPYVSVEEFVTPYKKKRTSKTLIKKVGEYEELFPYNQQNFFDAPGRWLGFGVGELLSGLQEHYNEKWNLYRKKDILDLRGIFLHKYTDSSNSLTQDYLENLDTGTVLSMSNEEDFQRLVIDMKTSEFLATTDKLYELARLIMGISAQGTGEDLPSSVSATASVINKQVQQTTYDFVREKLHHYLVKLFTDGYFEDILTEIDDEDLSVIVGDPRELEELDKYFINNLVNAKVLEWKKKTGIYPSETEVDRLRQMLTEDMRSLGDTRYAKLTKELMDKAGYSIEFYVTNESQDIGRKIQSLLQLKADPTFTGSRAALDASILDLLGENPGQYRKTPEEKAAEMEATRMQMIQEMANAGGQNSISGATNGQSQPIAPGEMGKYTGEEQQMRSNRV